jgi:hypothetical protein
MVKAFTKSFASRLIEEVKTKWLCIVTESVSSGRVSAPAEVFCTRFYQIDLMMVQHIIVGYEDH